MIATTLTSFRDLLTTQAKYSEVPTSCTPSGTSEEIPSDPASAQVTLGKCEIFAATM